MTLTVDLTPEQEARLQERASKAGLPLREYTLSRLFQQDDENGLPIAPAECVEYWRRKGLLSGFPDAQDSPEFARELRRQAETREW